LRPEELRLKLRQLRPHRLVVFAVDTSDSMGDGPEAGMRAALGAALALAGEAYLNRDLVSLVTFRGETAQTLVPPTNSVARLRRSLGRLPVGGATPLAAGIRQARQVIRQARAREPGLDSLLAKRRCRCRRAAIPTRTACSWRRSSPGSARRYC